MCRRLKHCQLTPDEERALVNRITQRLAAGTFSEQFRDQLRLAIKLDTQTTLSVATQCLTAQKAHVRRLAAWVVNNVERRRENGIGI
jgi:uncharacterized protein (DUF2236 family)